mmetsp:Transcript_10332/g.18653  ORF Transcript_10332/g.18653 Transcript_10332/m.18653 type:complete len:208 (-) Transcript_10332:24-647(-)
MSLLWVNAWAHVFETLGQDDIEWYAVVTYEALINYHDIVVQELLEVVQSGMRRYHSRGRHLRRTASSNGQRLEMKNTGQYSQLHRRLPLRGNSNGLSKSPNSYLTPKKENVSLWKKCLSKTQCHYEVERLTKGVLPYFGFVSVRKNKILPLSSYPGTVTVSKEFGHVLFSSEGVALNKFRQSREDMDSLINYKPPLELISRMKDFQK